MVPLLQEESKKRAEANLKNQSYSPSSPIGHDERSRIGKSNAMEKADPDRSGNGPARTLSGSHAESREVEQTSDLGRLSPRGEGDGYVDEPGRQPWGRFEVLPFGCSFPTRPVFFHVGPGE